MNNSDVIMYLREQINLELNDTDKKISQHPITLFT
ncbi:hypothetical protein SAMN05518672_101108 [Chitinophaga sp. CF118]|nr:hypothetical protein SAMN05518672_101108 [Chitinophaga sp. CF118]